MQKSQFVIGSAAIVCLLVSAGCSGGSDEEQAAPATETQAPATTAAADTAAPAANVEFASLTGDAAAGEKDFAVCTTCHSVEAGVNKTGPSLHGVIGREAGTVEGFNYSDANKNSGITWTPEELFTYLADPQATIPGTKMIFPGLKDPQKRADVVAYLETQS